MSVAVALGGCAGPTPYQPSTSLSGSSGGYSEQRLASDRYRVTFAGNSMTSRETVENYLLYRAAELTVQQGYEWFIMADRDVERDRRVIVDRFNDGRWGFWGPRWRYWGVGIGWRSWDPFYGDPFWANDVDVRTIERYEASAEIVMRRDPPQGDDRRAFRAREVMENLRPNIQRPT
jgi:hypothetical protein